MASLEDQDDYRSSEDEDYNPDQDDDGGLGSEDVQQKNTISTEEAIRAQKASKRAPASNPRLARIMAGRQRQLSAGDVDGSSKRPKLAENDLDDLFERELGVHPSASLPDKRAKETKSKAANETTKRALNTNISSLTKPQPSKKQKKRTLEFRLPGSKPKEHKPASRNSEASAGTSSGSSASKYPHRNEADQRLSRKVEYEFAGEKVIVERSTSKSSRERDTAAISGNDALSSLLNNIEGPRKLTTLDKSEMDWKQHLKSSETVDDRRRSGYLDEVEFLSRVDAREHEAELRQRGRP